jgi:arylsulfatase A-like enzyme
VNLYPDIHALIGLATIACASLAAVVGLRASWRPLAAIAGLLALSSAQPLVGALLDGRHALRHAIVARTSVVGRTVARVWPAERPRSDGSCEWPPPARAPLQPAAPRASILLVTIDAFRGDMGGERLTENLPQTTALLPAAARFDRAYAPAPRTTYSTYSMLTGMHPHELGFVAATTDVNDRFIPLADDDPIMIDPTKWKLRHRYPLGDQTPTLPGLLAPAGYATSAIVSDVALLPAAGITREFAEIDDAPYVAVGRRDLGGETSEITTDAGLAFLQRTGDRPFLAWLHYRDPHHPYTAYGDVSKHASDEVRYASELRRVDVALARLLSALHAQGRLARIIVIVTGDHGEEFRDHGGQYHGTTLYEELVHVPLFVAMPGGEARVLDQPVSLTDLVPTLLDLVGVVQPADLDGQSFAPLLLDEPWVPRPVFAYNTSYTAAMQRQAAVVDGMLKLVEDEGKGTLELFDLASDPHERTNLADLRTQDTARLRCLLQATGAFAGPG